MLHKKAHHVTRSEPFDKGGLDSCIITAYTAIVYKSYVIEGVVDYEKKRVLLKDTAYIKIKEKKL